MKKLTIVHGPQGCGKTLNAQAIMRELQADCIHDTGGHLCSLVHQTEKVIELLLRNDHVAVLVTDDVYFTLGRKIQRELNNHASLKQTGVHYRRFGGVMRAIAEKAESMPAAVIIYSEERELDTERLKAIALAVRCDVIQQGDQCAVISPCNPRRSAFVTNKVDYTKERLMRNAASRGQNPNDLRIELYQMSDLLPQLKTDFTGLEQRTAEFASQLKLTIPCGVRNFSLREANAVVRGVAHGATMYAMGIAEGLLMGGKELTIVVDGDDEARALNLNYPFIRWDCGRVRVRTVSEMMMVAAEAGKNTLGMTAWVVDVKPASLNALLELQQWESFTAVLSGPNFDTFAQERSV